MGGRFDSTLHDEFRRRLLEIRERLLRAVAASDEEAAALEAPGPGDAPDHAASRSLATLMSRLAGQEKRELDEVSAALRRLGSGVYGMCEACHEPIALARLRALPAARYCVHCQANQEVLP
jgi:RNA polymerase-binding transcription factor